MVTPEDFNVSVVIPTMGREELTRALDSVSRQSYQPLEVIVVNDSPSQEDLQFPFVHLVCVELKTGGSRGANAARQLGINHSSGTLIALLDDDDVWEPRHLFDAVDRFQEDSKLSVYASRVVIESASNECVSSTVIYKGRQSVFDFYYGKRAFLHRRRSLKTPTLVFKNFQNLPRLDETMHWQEDIDWLIRLDDAKFKVRQFSEIGARVYFNPERAAGRCVVDSYLEIARVHEGRTNKRGAKFLVAAPGRYYAFHGDLLSLKRIRSAAIDDFDATQLQRVQLALQIGICRLVKSLGLRDRAR